MFDLTDQLNIPLMKEKQDTVTTNWNDVIMQHRGILGTVRDKCLELCKCLRCSKSRFTTFSNSTDCQK